MPAYAYVVAGVLLVVALVGVVFLVKRPKAGASPVAGKPALLGVWNAFLRKLPREARYFPVAIVLGDSRAGKTRLVASRVQWEGQDRQLLPSAIGDARLQLYVGRDVVVQEVSAALLRDTRDAVKSELRALWGQFKDRTPVVVVVLDASKLPSADDLKALGELVRGKVNLISEIRKARTEVRVCLSHLDQLEGYTEFVALLGAGGSDLVVSIPEHPTEDDLGRCLEPYEAYLPQALTSSSADFKKVVGFFAGRAPPALRALAPFLRALGDQERLSYEPIVRGLHLSGYAPDDHLGDPFVVDRSAAATAAVADELRTKRICGGLLAFGALATVALYALHYRAVVSAEEAVEAFAEAALVASQPPANSEASAAARIKEQAAGEQLRTVRAWSTRLGPLVDGSFASTKQATKARFLATTRRLYLLPLIDPKQDGYKVVHALAVLYAYRDSELGKLIESDLAGAALGGATTDGTEAGAKHALCQAPPPSPEAAPVAGPASAASASPQASANAAAASSATAAPQASASAASSAWAPPPAAASAMAAASALFAPRAAASTPAAQASGPATPWAEILNLPEAVVRDYVETSELEDYENLNDKAWKDRLASLPSTPTPTEQSDLGPWLNYLTDLTRAYASGSISPQRLQALQSTEVPLLDVLVEAKRYGDAKKLLAVLNREKRVDLAAVGPLLSKREAPAWVNEHQTELTAVLCLVKNGDLSGTPSERMSLAQLMTQLDNAPPSAVADAKYTLDVKQQSFTYRTKDWVSLLARSRGALLLQAFYDAYRDTTKWPFFVQEPSYPDVGLAAVAGKGPTRAVPGVFTKNAFDREVAPALEGFDAQLSAAQLSAEDRSKLKAYVAAASRRYAEHYRDSLKTYYASFQLHAGSGPVLAAVVSELTLPASWFVDFLRTVSENAGLEIKDVSYLKPMSEELQAFKPFVALMTAQKGQYPNLEKYIAFLAPLMTATPGGTPVAAPDKGPTLAEVLSPMGRAGLSMMREEKESILLQVEPWLAATGILGRARDPFLLPVQLGYGYAMDEIGQVLGQQWRQQILPDILPVLTRFPFRQDAEPEATISDVEALFVPLKGRFWGAFDRVIAPVCVQKSGSYAALAGPLGSPKLPSGMLSTTNALVTMTGALWTKDGKPQALPLTVKPLPLPRGGTDDQVATLSFLKTAKTSVFGFNQKPSWHDLELAWWDEDMSSVGFQLSVPGTGAKRSQSIDVADSTWSFYRLLQRGSVSKKGTGTWKLPGDAGGETAAREVQFAVQGAPWAPFQVPVEP